MSQELIFFPFMTQAMFTLVIAFLLAKKRISAIKSKQIDPKYFRVFQGYEAPNDLLKISRNFQNLLELPIIFYMVVIAVYLLNKVDVYYLILSWGFVVTRIVHSYIHIGSNKVLARFRIFGLGYLILTVMCMRIFIQLF